jgi:hypothetical protein
MEIGPRTELDDLVRQYQEAGVAEKLVGTDLCYERGTDTVLKVIRALDITEKMKVECARFGPTFLCYGEASYGALVQFRNTDPEGNWYFHFVEGIDDLKVNAESRRKMERHVVPQAKEGFVDFIINYAPPLTGEAIGRPLTKNDRLSFI